MRTARNAGRPMDPAGKRATGKRVSLILGRADAETLDRLKESTGLNTTQVLERALRAYWNGRARV